MDSRDFLSAIPHETINTSRERVELFRLGTFAGRVFELVYFPCGKHDPHIHDRVGSIIRIVSGTGEATLNGKLVPYSSGDIFDYPAGTPHGFDVKSPTIMLTELGGPIMDPITKQFDFRYADD